MQSRICGPLPLRNGGMKTLHNRVYDVIIFHFDGVNENSSLGEEKFLTGGGEDPVTTIEVFLNRSSKIVSLEILGGIVEYSTINLFCCDYIVSSRDYVPSCSHCGNNDHLECIGTQSSNFADDGEYQFSLHSPGRGSSSRRSSALENCRLGCDHIRDYGNLVSK